MLGSLGNRPFQDSAVVTCPVNGLRVEDALERSLDIPEGVWEGNSCTQCLRWTQPREINC